MLNNTLWMLQNEKKLSVGYFGGSITAGAGASDSRVYSWRALTTAWFREQFPDCCIEEIYAAIGGTGSALGMFRAEHDLLCHQPDLVFIEFSVNDSDMPYDETLASSEAIVRQIYSKNPFAEIIYVHTIGPGLLESTYAQGKEYVSRAAHSAVMHRYGIAQLDLGEILRETVRKDNNNWDDYMNGGPHPSDKGYRVYADAVAKLLQQELACESLRQPKQLPPPISLSDRSKARFVDAWCIDAPGWEKIDKPMRCYEHYLEATQPGAAFTYTFYGKRIGLNMKIYRDSGDLTWSIDGSEEQILRTWNHFCMRLNNLSEGVLLGDELPEGEHTLTLRVADSKAEESEGHAIRFGAFMIY